ncbi:unnamed protein product [Lymnaea stagnalis]|uniref:Noggin n=1 Tax=Lymnaea stagnalis TaxID=6523 RepID=A0AAV2H924_LYMST
MTPQSTLLLFFVFYASANTDFSEPLFRLLQTDGPQTKHGMARRPSPSDHLPIEDLVENESAIYDPRPSDINTRSLRKQLGSKFKRDFMSVQDPNKRSTPAPPLIPLHNGRPQGKRPGFLSLLRSAVLQDGTRVELPTTKKERRKFQKYLWNLTYCPVMYSWKYLGIRFWPQWIKEGSCVNKRSCSLPEGMMCAPSMSSNIALLRWHCADFNDHTTCQWIRVYYPIITECACSC